MQIQFKVCTYLQRACSPEPSVSFKKRSGSLPLGRHKIRREGTELFIENVQPLDEGDYVCKASNRVGDAEEIIQIAVEGSLRDITRLIGLQHQNQISVCNTVQRVQCAAKQYPLKFFFAIFLATARNFYMKFHTFITHS